MRTLSNNLKRDIHCAISLFTIGFLAVTGNAYAGTEVPIKGTLAGSFVEGDPEAPNIFIAELSGKISHLGEAKINVLADVNDLYFIDTDGNITDSPVVEINDDGIPVALATIKQTVTFSAANGDELWVTQWAIGFMILVGPGSGAFPLSDIEATIEGGTGRFEDATGSYTASAVQLIVPGADNDLVETSLNGMISTVGSKRKK